jgi:hypothetical protein
MTLNFSMDAVEHWHGGQRLYRYVFLPQVPLDEAPRPYFHPVCTLSGTLVTDFQPADHRWHHGISFTVPDLNSVNFWGGNTDVPGQGYVMLANQGTVEHIGFEPSGAADTFTEVLHWRDPQGALMLHETRTIRSTILDADRWALEFATILTNRMSTAVRFKAWPAGYGGLFWRGLPTFTQRRLSTGETPIMGRRAAQLVYSSAAATVTLEDQPENPRYPNQWFSRGDDEGYVGACFGLFHNTPYDLPAGEYLSLRYRLIFADQMVGTRI